MFKMLNSSVTFVFEMLNTTANIRKHSSILNVQLMLPGVMVSHQLLKFVLGYKYYKNKKASLNVTKTNQKEKVEISTSD